ncbi:hypothetical protein [Sodaliphilus pleomorphus]|uniref:Uncharacterized protein n=1 Tax=Sodaliphilus pleomorphus TaxID=2606626 RepID=A0A6L5XDU8_9BACT|nr:hypothetical protein [Sodaliphilus pleomorphus]MSS17488.1 hypothetical protein [Sodaliphilus pleomorphus]
MQISYYRCDNKTQPQQDKNVPASIFSFIQTKVFHHSENYYCTISFCLVPHCLVSGFLQMLGEKNKQMSYTGISVLPSRRKIMKKERSGKFLFVFFFELACISWLAISAFFAGQVLLGLK